MTDLNHECPPYDDKCHKCYIANIKNSVILEFPIIQCWIHLYEKQLMTINNMSLSSVDARLEIIALYVTIPSIFHESIRSIFLEYFDMKNICKETLDSGKWLPYHVNLKRNLLEQLWITQEVKFSNIQFYMDALDFFTKESFVMHRSKAAHRMTDSMAGAANIPYDHIFRKFCTLMHCVIDFEDFVVNSRN